MLETFSYSPEGLLLSYSQRDAKIGSPTLNQVRFWTYCHTILASGLKLLTTLDGPGLVANGITNVSTYTHLNWPAFAPPQSHDFGNGDVSVKPLSACDVSRRVCGVDTMRSGTSYFFMNLRLRSTLWSRWRMVDISAQVSKCGNSGYVCKPRTTTLARAPHNRFAAAHLGLRLMIEGVITSTGPVDVQAMSRDKSSGRKIAAIRCSDLSTFIAVFDRNSPATRCGCRKASRCAIMPPKEQPATSTRSILRCVCVTAATRGFGYGMKLGVHATFCSPLPLPCLLFYR